MLFYANIEQKTTKCYIWYWILICTPMHNAIWYAKMSFLLLNNKNVINTLINLSLNAVLNFVIKII